MFGCNFAFLEIQAHTKIDELDSDSAFRRAAGDHDIFRLNIPVNYALFVQVLDSR